MKKGKLLHAELSHLIAGLGHGDTIVVGDAGLPVPPGVRCIDLAVTQNVPRLLDVLDSILAEMHVEKAWIAEELARGNPTLAQAIGDRLPQAQPLQTETHAKNHFWAACAEPDRLTEGTPQHTISNLIDKYNK